MCLLMSDPFTLCDFWKKCYHWVMLQWYLWTESYFRLLSLHFPAICQKIPCYRHFWPFCTICACLRANSAPSLLVLIKILLLGAVAAIPVKRKLTQAITTRFSRHWPENLIFGRLWPFFTICACSWAIPWSHLRFYWHNYYHWVLLQWYLWGESCSRLLPLHFLS